jgi:hypothetical protein
MCFLHVTEKILAVKLLLHIDPYSVFQFTRHAVLRAQNPRMENEGYFPTASAEHAMMHSP